MNQWIPRLREFKMDQWASIRLHEVTWSRNAESYRPITWLDPPKGLYKGPEQSRLFHSVFWSQQPYTVLHCEYILFKLSFRWNKWTYILAFTSYLDGRPHSGLYLRSQFFRGTGRPGLWRCEVFVKVILSANCEVLRLISTLSTIF